MNLQKGCRGSPNHIQAQVNAQVAQTPHRPASAQRLWTGVTGRGKGKAKVPALVACAFDDPAIRSASTPAKVEDRTGSPRATAWPSRWSTPLQAKSQR